MSSTHWFNILELRNEFPRDHFSRVALVENISYVVIGTECDIASSIYIQVCNLTKVLTSLSSYWQVRTKLEQLSCNLISRENKSNRKNDRWWFFGRVGNLVGIEFGTTLGVGEFQLNRDFVWMFRKLERVKRIGFEREDEQDICGWSGTGRRKLGVRCHVG